MSEKDRTSLGRLGLRAGSVSFNNREFDRRSSQSREARVSINFAVADLSYTMPHALGFTPTSYTPVRVTRDPTLGPPGTIYDLRPWANDHYVTLLCSTDSTMAEIILR